MAKSINSFIVRLADQTAFRPQLIVSTRPVADKKGVYLVRLLNPNTKEEVHSEEFIATAKSEMDQIKQAIEHGKQLLNLPKFLEIQFSLEYKEQIFISQGKRGKMKLKTENSEEAIAEREKELLKTLPDYTPEEEVEIDNELVEELETEESSVVEVLIPEEKKTEHREEKNKNKSKKIKKDKKERVLDSKLNKNKKKKVDTKSKTTVSSKNKKTLKAKNNKKTKSRKK